MLGVFKYLANIKDDEELLIFSIIYEIVYFSGSTLYILCFHTKCFNEYTEEVIFFHFTLSIKRCILFFISQGIKSLQETKPKQNI